MTDSEVRQYLKMSDDDDLIDFHRHIAEIMSKYDRDHEGVPWEPFAYYSVHGDLLKVYWSQDSSYAKWHDHHLTTLYSHDNKDVLVGFQVWGLKRLMEKGSYEKEYGQPRVFYSKQMDCVHFDMAHFQPFVEESLPHGITLTKKPGGEIIGGTLINITRLVREAEAQERKLQGE
jgi:hypothetical protein